jgi:hypothetical protein
MEQYKREIIPTEQKPPSTTPQETHRPPPVPEQYRREHIPASAYKLPVDDKEKYDSERHEHDNDGHEDQKVSPPRKKGFFEKILSYFRKCR